MDTTKCCVDGSLLENAKHKHSTVVWTPSASERNSFSGNSSLTPISTRQRAEQTLSGLCSEERDPPRGSVCAHPMGSVTQPDTWRHRLLLSTITIHTARGIHPFTHIFLATIFTVIATTTTTPAPTRPPSTLGFWVQIIRRVSWLVNHYTLNITKYCSTSYLYLW